jgi:hypothetical protein
MNRGVKKLGIAFLLYLWHDTLRLQKTYYVLITKTPVLTERSEVLWFVANIKGDRGKPHFLTGGRRGV